jgi:hypothetical protein
MFPGDPGRGKGVLVFASSRGSDPHEPSQKEPGWVQVERGDLEQASYRKQAIRNPLEAGHSLGLGKKVRQVSTLRLEDSLLILR